MEKDPVCGMQVKVEQAAAQSEYAGQTWYFCCAACKEKFEANPQAYTTRKAVKS